MDLSLTSGRIKISCKWKLFYRDILSFSRNKKNFHYFFWEMLNVKKTYKMCEKEIALSFVVMF